MENNKLIVAPEPDVMPGLTFDFEFICQTLNLIQIKGGTAAVNLTSIADIEQDEKGEWSLTLEHGYQYDLNDGEMAEFEQNLRRRIEDNKARSKETMKENALMQAAVVAELQSGVQPGVIVGAAPQGRRFRQ